MTDYLHQLTRLRTDTNRTRWTEATAHRAPHKPFLLLSILDLAAQRQIDSPFIEPSFDLTERFTRYWELAIVEAAHIRPWADSQDDRPVNGLALCRLCH